MNTIDCKYCLSSSESSRNKMIYPCKCHNGVHAKCILKWITHSNKTHCEICTAKYHFSKSMKHKIKRIYKRNNTVDLSTSDISTRNITNVNDTVDLSTSDNNCCSTLLYFCLFIFNIFICAGYKYDDPVTSRVLYYTRSNDILRYDSILSNMFVLYIICSTTCGILHIFLVICRLFDHHLSYIDNTSSSQSIFFRFCDIIYKYMYYYNSYSSINKVLFHITMDNIKYQLVGIFIYYVIFDTIFFNIFSYSLFIGTIGSIMLILYFIFGIYSLMSYIITKLISS